MKVFIHLLQAAEGSQLLYHIFYVKKLYVHKFQDLVMYSPLSCLYWNLPLEVKP